MTKQELLEQKGRLVSQADEILSKAKEEGRYDLTAEENKRWEDIHADIDKMTAFVAKLEKQDALAEGTGRRTEQPNPEMRTDTRSDTRPSFTSAGSFSFNRKIFSPWAGSSSVSFLTILPARPRTGLNMAANGNSFGFGAATVWIRASYAPRLKYARYASRV